MNAPRVTWPFLLLCGCGSEPPPPYEPVADVRKVMASILEPAAETYWDAVGWILDFEGTHEIKPATPEDWEAVRNAAYVMAESGNLLMMEGRSLDDDAWMAMAQAMVAAGRRALAAAEAEDPMAVFDVGAEVYAVCSNCHAVYALETLRPSDERSN
jgi:hypothetical protein